jgi:predicted SnoaL-like aldol condensation-catalyzing enzyme
LITHIFKYLSVLFVSALILAACGTIAATPAATPLATPQAEINRAATIDAFTRIFKGDATAVDQYFAQDFINHNPFGGGQGLEAYRQLSKQLGAAGFPLWKPLRSIASGNYVALQGLYHFESIATFKPNQNAPGVVAVDLFRFENGKIAEHWDALQDVVPAASTPDNNDMLGGPAGKPGTPALDPKVVQDAVVALSKGETDSIKTLFSEKYINHNPYGGDGWAGLEQLASVFGQAGFQLYTPLRAFADGDLVILHGIFHFESIASFKPNAEASGVIAFDIFRVENGKIVEHWDVLQNNVPTSQTSGKISTTGDGLNK